MIANRQRLTLHQLWAPPETRGSLIAFPFAPVQPSRVGRAPYEFEDPEDTGVGAPETTKEDVLQKLAPVISDTAAKLLDSSATENVEVLRAKIANHKRMMKYAPEGPMRDFYRNQISVLTAKLNAAKQAKNLEKEEQASVRTWRVLGYTVTGTGVAIGGGVVLLLLALARRANRR